MFVCVHVRVSGPSLRMNFNQSYYTSAPVRIHQKAAALAAISIAERTSHSGGRIRDRSGVLERLLNSRRHVLEHLQLVVHHAYVPPAAVTV